MTQKNQSLFYFAAFWVSQELIIFIWEDLLKEQFRFLELFFQPLLLFFDGQVAVVQQ